MSQIVQHTSEPCYHTEYTGRWKTQVMNGNNNGGDRIIDDSDGLTGAGTLGRSDGNGGSGQRHDGSVMAAVRQMQEVRSEGCQTVGHQRTL
jgi:hypothetical protein